MLNIKPLNIFLITVLVIIAVLASNHLWHHDVLFHTDVARDFLVLQEMIETKKPTLIGPRSGGIPGVFHGPLWFYINLPIFMIVSGNPVLMGWYWWLLGIYAIICFLWVCYKISRNLTTSLLAGICYTAILLPGCAGPVNDYIANLYSFLVFLIMLYWYQKPQLKSAILSWLGLGLLVQFQMAFAAPLTFIWAPLFLFRTIKTKLYKQLLAIPFFIIPLLTFILFEVRHDFLQTKSVLYHISSHGESTTTLIERITDRLSLMFFDNLNLFKLPEYIAPTIIGLFILFSLKSKRELIKNSLILLGIFYIAWWPLSFLFSGTVWRYYYSPFFSMILLIIGLIAAASKKAQYLLAILTCVLVVNTHNSLFYQPERFNASSWKLLNRIAQTALIKPNRGYFLYSQDQLAYPLKYAFSYYQKTNPDSQAYAFQKQSETILVKGQDNPRNPYATAEDWQLNRIKINKEPIETIDFKHYALEIYQLTQEEIEIEVDPYLVTDLHFR